jgi:hypothetical protein
MLRSSFVVVAPRGSPRGGKIEEKHPRKSGNIAFLGRLSQKKV